MSGIKERGEERENRRNFKLCEPICHYKNVNCFLWGSFFFWWLSQYLNEDPEVIHLCMNMFTYFCISANLLLCYNHFPFPGDHFSKYVGFVAATFAWPSSIPALLIWTTLKIGIRHSESLSRNLELDSRMLDNLY